MNTAEEILQNVTIKGLIVKLPPGQLDRKLYLDVAKRINLIGGKWRGGKIGGFLFQHDPSELIQQIAAGEKRNLQKDYQFFETSDSRADNLVEKANIEERHRILEPSAGQGAIIKAIARKLPDIVVDCFELMEVNRSFLKRLKNASLIGTDFLRNDCQAVYDRIVANPPFSKNQDIDHIREMYRLLRPGGRLVSAASKHWELSRNKKEREFRKWLELLDADISDIPAGEFKESGTMVGSLCILINKPL